MTHRFLSVALASAVFTGWLSASASAGQVCVRVAPPRPVVERVVPRPAPRCVWTGGYYRWTGRAYRWVPGAWVFPPRPRAVWVRPHWNYVAPRRGYVFVAGFWR